MSSSALRFGLYAALAALFVLRNDLWLWNDARLVFGLPTGLTYHVAFCAVTVAVMALLAKYAWPTNLGLSTDDSDADS